MNRIIQASWLVVLSLLLPFGAFAQDHKHAHERHRHPEYAKIKNPAAMTEQSISTGRRIYEKNCAACHGASGKGDAGPGLTGAVLTHGNTDGEIFHVISDGAAKVMKGYKEKLTEEERWDLVNYVKILRNTEPGR
jgi:mono/diheme cytochrome c family protein